MQERDQGKAKLSIRYSRSSDSSRTYGVSRKPLQAAFVFPLLECSDTAADFEKLQRWLAEMTSHFPGRFTDICKWFNCFYCLWSTGIHMSLNYHYSPYLWLSVNRTVKKTKGLWDSSDGSITSRCLLKDLAVWPKTGQYLVIMNSRKVFSF